ncbi:hypothetical protein L0156_14915 [bacterium]|nr:hypothetical protein [bacterium]
MKVRNLLFSLFIFVLTTPAHAAVQPAPDLVQNVQIKQALRLFEVWADAVFAYEKIPGSGSSFSRTDGRFG